MTVRPNGAVVPFGVTTTRSWAPRGTLSGSAVMVIWLFESTVNGTETPPMVTVVAPG